MMFLNDENLSPVAMEVREIGRILSDLDKRLALIESNHARKDFVQDAMSRMDINVARLSGSVEAALKSIGGVNDRVVQLFELHEELARCKVESDKQLNLIRTTSDIDRVKRQNEELEARNRALESQHARDDAAIASSGIVARINACIGPLADNLVKIAMFAAGSFWALKWLIENWK